MGALLKSILCINFFFLSFSVLIAQEIDFLITDVSIYVNGSLNIDKTKEARDDITGSFKGFQGKEIERNPELKIFFYPDTDEIHMKLPSSTKSHLLSASWTTPLNFRSENTYDMYRTSYMFKMYKRSGSHYTAKYSWSDGEVVANFTLNLNKAFAYIRGGTLENVGENLSGDRTHKTVITFERK